MTDIIWFAVTELFPEIPCSSRHSIIAPSIFLKLPMHVSLAFSSMAKEAVPRALTSVVFLDERLVLRRDFRGPEHRRPKKTIAAQAAIAIPARASFDGGEPLLFAAEPFADSATAGFISPTTIGFGELWHLPFAAVGVAGNSEV